MSAPQMALLPENQVTAVSGLPRIHGEMKSQTPAMQLIRSRAFRALPVARASGSGARAFEESSSLPLLRRRCRSTHAKTIASVKAPPAVAKSHAPPNTSSNRIACLHRPLSNVRRCIAVPKGAAHETKSRQMRIAGSEHPRAGNVSRQSITEDELHDIF